jgi:nucleoside-diphosphate-sugar epimerase
MSCVERHAVAVTGSSGFIGCALVEELLFRQYAVRRIPRTLVGVRGCQCVIHLAARAHVIRETAPCPLSEYRLVNVFHTLQLARKAAEAGVGRFVFVSSIGAGRSFAGRVGGSGVSTSEFPWDPNLGEHYAISKWEAEQGLWEIASQTGMEVVVVRPPLVYGPSVKGNFARLLDLVRSGVPMPLAAVNNRRSFIGLDNLVNLLIRCVDHPKAAGQTLLVSDGQDLSTPELLHMIANAMGRPARLFPVPVPLLRLVGRALGRLNEVDRLVGSLQVDSSATRELLGWTPPMSVEEGIKRMVAENHKS